MSRYFKTQRSRVALIIVSVLVVFLTVLGIGGYHAGLSPIPAGWQGALATMALGMVIFIVLIGGGVALGLFVVWALNGESKDD